MPRRLLPAVATCVFLSLALVQQASAGEKASPPATTLNGLPLLYSENFDADKMEQWEPTDATAWKIVDQDGNRVYNQFKKRSKFKTPVRQPFNRSLLKDINVGSFVLDVKLQSTHPDYGHRDLCLFFGYQDDLHLH